MVKLLRGRELYIAKHVRNQIVAQTSEIPKDPKPATRMPVCVTSVTNGGALLALQQVGLLDPATHTVWKQGTKIDDVSWKFTGLPDKFPPSSFCYSIYPTHYVYPKTVQTFQEAQGLHFARFQEAWQIYPRRTAWPWTLDGDWYTRTTTITKVAADTYHFEGPTTLGGTVSIGLSITMSTPYVTHHHFVGYNFPIGLSIYVNWKNLENIPPGCGHVERHSDGTYHEYYYRSW